MVFLNKDNFINIYKTENINGVPVYVIEDNYIRVQLTSKNIDANIERKISKYDTRQLKTISELVTNKDILERVYCKGFSVSDFYMIILKKATESKDFLRWWRCYGFKINIYKLKK